MRRSSSAARGPVVMTRPSTLTFLFVSVLAVLIGRALLSRVNVACRLKPKLQKRIKKPHGTVRAPKGPHCQTMPALGTGDAADATPGRMASQTRASAKH